MQAINILKHHWYVHFGKYLIWPHTSYDLKTDLDPYTPNVNRQRHGLPLWHQNISQHIYTMTISSLWFQNSLRFTGLQVLDPHISYAPQEISADERTNTLQCWANRLKTIWTEKPVEFIHIKHFDKENAFQLHKSFMENNSKDIKPTAGQNLGRLKGKPLIWVYS